MKLNLNAVNALALVAIQGANALFPLFVFPYLLKVLGKESFAELVVAEAMALYALTVCLYGFDTSGVQSIIESRKQGGKAREAACLFNILGARIILLGVSALLLFGINAIVLGVNSSVLSVWLLYVLGMILQSNFYFQAIEQNFALAVIITLSRVIAVLAIYFLIQSEADYLLASMILAGSFLISGCGAFVLLMARFGFRVLGFIQLNHIYCLLVEGRHLFFGNLSVALFRGANILILSGVSNAGAVSAYALAEKIIKSIQALARPMNQVFAPKAIKAWSLLDAGSKDERRASMLIWKSTRVQVLLMSLTLPFIVGAIYAGHLSGVLPGFDEEAIKLIAIMSPAVICGVANSMFGAVGLSLLGAQSYFARCVFLVGGCAFLICLMLSNFFGAVGAAFSFLLAEACLLIAFLWKYQGKFSRG
ncbi:putative O-antigen transporter [compost metagenome]